MLQFLDRGFVVLKPDVPKSTHDALFARAEQLYDARERLGNSSIGFNLIADNLRVNAPQINQVVGSTVVDTGLTAILGKDYYSYGHSFLHKSGPQDQMFHKDAPLPWGTRGGIRSHRPYWILAFYYPQNTTVEIGATQVLPGTQYWNVDREDTGNTAGEDRLELSLKRDEFKTSSSLRELDRYIEQQWLTLDPETPPEAVEVEKGSVLLVHFDLFHRGARNVDGSSRYLFKFEFTRMCLPALTANGDALELDFAKVSDLRRTPVIQGISRWMLDSGEKRQSSKISPLTSKERSCEADRVANAYSRGLNDDSSLIEEFQSGVESQRRASMYGLTCAPELAARAAEEMLASRRVNDRSAAAFLLGEILHEDQQTVDRLVSLCNSEDKSDVRANAITALGKIGTHLVSTGQETRTPEIAIALINTATHKQDVPTNRTLGTNNLRQLAWLALLRIITNAIAHNVRLDPYASVFEAAELSSRREVDRYARQTANELMLRVADAGNANAMHLATARIREEQWCA